MLVAGGSHTLHHTLAFPMLAPQERMFNPAWHTFNVETPDQDAVVGAVLIRLCFWHELLRTALLNQCL